MDPLDYTPWSPSEEGEYYDSSSDAEYSYKPSDQPRRRKPDSNHPESRENIPSEQGSLGRMSSWLHHHASSHQSQLAATALLSGVAVAGGILGYQALKRQEAVRELKASIPDVNERHHAEKVSVN